MIILLIVFCGCANDMTIEKDKIIKEDLEFDLTVYRGACFPEVSDKYVYPIVPGMEEWLEANQVIGGTLIFNQLPDTVLKSISTTGLIDALIHAPLFVNSGAFTNLNDLQWFLNEIYPKINSASELFNRKDAGDVLVAFYNYTCFDCIETLIGVEPWVLGVSFYELWLLRRIMGLEFLFTKQEILDKIGHEKKKEVVAALLAKYEQRPDYINAIYPMVYLMFADEYAPIVKYSQEHDKEFHFILNGYLNSSYQVDLIVSYAKSFINN